MRIVSLLILLSPKSLGLNFLPFLIIWNVGQGQWTSYVTPSYCIHIDAGGEFYPKQVERWCSRKTNYVQISHWDKDHYSFLYKIKRFGPMIQNLHSPLVTIYSTNRFKDKNSNSTIHYLKEVLFVGDSTIKAEKIWANLTLPKVKVLLVPHHGSQTSSSEYLLKHLPNLK
ncbi:MAG: hypothetical protein KDD37_07675, partial [Bdellovibrionales bacterium]|nr:hypothetical protein [Bdellovibrionales bacterium]